MTQGEATRGQATRGQAMPGAATLRGIIADAAARLADAGVPSPRHDAEALAAHVLGVERADLIVARDPDGAQVAAYQELVRRRATREPLQHITGESHFRHVTVRVGPGVFVPRPETELTAGVAVDEARRVRQGGDTPIVTDLYSGSGAIAISVAAEVPGTIVHAVEADDDAVRWLRRNAADWRSTPSSEADQLVSDLTAHHADVAGCETGVLVDVAGAVHVVVANPPYVPVGARIRDPEVISHDPALALWSGEDGLDAMRVLERTAAALLRPGGLLVAEHADVQGTAAPAVFTSTGRWVDVADHADLAGRPRYVTAVYAGP
jgi:release factor glutamine methyltransferase